MSWSNLRLSNFKRKRSGEGVQEWPDGSRYEGQFVEDLKQGHGVYTWPGGQSYEGSFYKDFRHGSGIYTWPDGSQFIGKFYLNRKEGYGVHMFRDGTVFEGLFHADKRFGPGVITYVDGRQDVGVWYKKWLIRLCNRVEGAFTLQDVPGYNARLAKQEYLSQIQIEISTKLIDISPLDDPSSLEDDILILPPDTFYYCTDSDHLPITRSLRKELDLLFFGSSDIATPTFPEDMPLELQIEAHIHAHRFEAKGLPWDVAAVLAMNRGAFGPKGPLELSSERLIRKASFGVSSAVHQILVDGNVHPDVSDAGGFTALIAATVNCHDDVIHLLLDRGADVDKLNEEGMSALSVCAVLYYPFQSLYETVAERTPDSPDTPEDDSLVIKTPSTLTNTSLAESFYLLKEGPEPKTEEVDTVGQTDQLLGDPSSKHFSYIVEPEPTKCSDCLQHTEAQAEEALEPKEDSDCPNKAEKVLQHTEAQAEEAPEPTEDSDCPNKAEQVLQHTEAQAEEAPEPTEDSDCSNKAEKVLQHTEAQAEEALEPIEVSDCPNKAEQVLQHTEAQAEEALEPKEDSDCPNKAEKVLQHTEAQAEEALEPTEDNVCSNKAEKVLQHTEAQAEEALEPTEESDCSNKAEQVFQHTEAQAEEALEPTEESDCSNKAEQVLQHTEAQAEEALEPTEDSDCSNKAEQVLQHTEAQPEEALEPIEVGDCPNKAEQVFQHTEAQAEEALEPIEVGDCPNKAEQVLQHTEAQAEEALEPTEDSDCSNKAEQVLQHTEAQAEEALEPTEDSDCSNKAEQVLQHTEAQAEEALEPTEDSDCPNKAEQVLQHTEAQAEEALEPTEDSDSIVTEGIKQQMAEVLCQSGHVKPAETQETVRMMALVKTELQRRWSTLNLLLNRGSDPNVSSIPMPVIFLSIKAGHVEGVWRLLESGARTDLPLTAELKGLYPLHIAAGLPGREGPKITQLLLHGLADPDAKAQDASELFQLDSRSRVEALVGCVPSPTTGSQPPPDIYTTSTEVPVEGGRTPLHVACQRDSDYSNARDVVSILLSHKANTSYLWSGHSPLSLAIASGNDLAVDELLAGGADPNLPLSRHVGSALCTTANFSYDCGPKPYNRIKLVEKLIKAGANILMPVVVGEGNNCTVGTAVDYAYYQFKQDKRICHTPYHILNQYEKETFNVRRKLLDTLGVLLRQAAISMEKQCLEQSQDIQSVSPQENLVYSSVEETPPQTREQTHEKSAPQWNPLFKYCYQCGCSAWVVLKPCGHCRKVFYCSKTCKMKAWNERHKEECIRLSGSGKQQSPLAGRSSAKGQEMAKKVPGSCKKSLKTYKRGLESSNKGHDLQHPHSSHTSAHRHKPNPKENYSFI